MKRLLILLAAAAVVLSGEPSNAVVGAPTLADVSNAITELDVVRARELIDKVHANPPALSFQRARLSIYVGDCDTASATLGSLEPTPEVRDLADLAKACARAVAGAVVVDDPKNGLWIRLQNADDRALVPFITDVAVRARRATERDLSVTLPRPLRIDLVSDLFSLSAISGLPLQAAETTGTVAVARWGRVTMLSPRAASLGYPWQDTLAHEITHLAVTRATRDHAPLWLQEGLAKHEEARWRAERPFDGMPDPDSVARTALAEGESVGIDQLGASIAMLPTPRAASIAFAEVQSFVEYFLEERGKHALALLLIDAKGLKPDEAAGALRSVTGYDLSQWIVLWQTALRDKSDSKAPVEVVSTPPLVDPRSLARSARLGDLLFSRAHHAQAADEYRSALEESSRQAALRWRLGRALVAMGREEEGAPLFASTEDIDDNHAGWHALRGRFMKRAGRAAEADRAFELAIALNPFLEDAACEGHFSLADEKSPPLPEDPARRALCVAARKIARE